MAATAVTLNDLESHSPLAGLFKCNLSNTFVPHFTRFQPTVCSHGSSALAELLVQLVATPGIFIWEGDYNPGV